MARKKKTTAKKARRSASGGSPSSRTGKKTSTPRKKKVVKKKAKKKVARKKPTKQERKATRALNRKPRTNHDEVKDYFQRETRALTPALTAELKMVFCRAYAQRGIVREGTTAAGISRKTYTRWRKDDESFNEACKEAESMAADLIESEAMRRAIDGFDRPVIYKGEVTDTYTDYSDSLMGIILKGNKKEKYKERTEHSGSVGRPMTLEKEDKEQVVSSILSMIVNKPDPD